MTQADTIWEAANLLTTVRRDAEPDGCKHLGRWIMLPGRTVAGFLIFRPVYVAYAQRDLSSAGLLLSPELACPDVTRRADAPSVSDAYVLE